MSKYKNYFSDDINMIFNQETGLSILYGKTLEEDIEFAKCGPELCDIELSCSIDSNVAPEGWHITPNDCNNKSCKVFCYKNNGCYKYAAHMPLQVIDKILSKIPKEIFRQVAYGVMTLEDHPEWYEIFKLTREVHDLIPNVTVNEKLTEDVSDKLVSVCGAVAVSVNKQNMEMAFDNINLLTNKGLKQCNIHFVIHEDNFEDALTLIDRVSEDKRTEKLNAIVFLQYKPKGLSKEKFKPLKDVTKYNQLINKCSGKISIGFDSCSACLFERSLENNPDKDKLMQYAIKCESSLLSWYINCFGIGFPCSFCEGEKGWLSGIDMLGDFLTDVWFNNRTKQFRKNLLENDRKCPMFNLD